MLIQYTQKNNLHCNNVVGTSQRYDEKLANFRGSIQPETKLNWFQAVRIYE